MNDLWRHQRAAIDFARDKAATMLNMGMGTGKTRTAIELLNGWDARHVIVLAPLNVCSVWPKQIAAFAREQDWHVLRLDRGPIKQRAAALERAVASGRRVLATVNYEAFWRKPLRQALLAHSWDALVLDELHRCKAPFGKASKAAHELGMRARRRLGLTGTVMPNTPLDAWAQYKILDARLLGFSFVAFRAQYAVMSSRGGFPHVVGFRDPAGLAARLAPITFKVGREVLDLPPCMSETLEVELGAKGAAAYVALRDELRACVEQGSLTVDNVLTRSLRLAQVTGGYLPLDGEEHGVEVDTAKRDALAELIEDSGGEPANGAGGEPIVVFCRFQHDLDAVHAAAKAAGATSLELSGRRKELDWWQQGGARVLAVQQQTGGLGVDLTRARIAVFYSLGYSLGDYEQAQARVSRPGQTRPVIFYHLVARGTVDEVVYDALSKKKRVVEAVLTHLASGSEPVPQTDNEDEDDERTRRDRDGAPEAEARAVEAAERERAERVRAGEHDVVR